MHTTKQGTDAARYAKPNAKTPQPHLRLASRAGTTPLLPGLGVREPQNRFQGGTQGKQSDRELRGLCPPRCLTHQLKTKARKWRTESHHKRRVVIYCASHLNDCTKKRSREARPKLDGRKGPVTIDTLLLSTARQGYESPCPSTGKQMARRSKLYGKTLDFGRADSPWANSGYNLTSRTSRRYTATSKESHR